ncbi:hypothetical protein DFH29DRAFT_892327 [Suillus ampliporus]|nr:hypothetical protein DFH29DRAFT_892327 [Suillus ampliporus]
MVWSSVEWSCRCVPLVILNDPCISTTLPTCLRTRFKQRGILSDLEDAIALDGAALLHCPNSHPDRFRSLNNLVITLQNRFGQRSILFVLEEVIELVFRQK